MFNVGKFKDSDHVKNILKKYVSGVNEGSEFSKISVIFSRSFGRQSVSSFCYFLK